MHALSKEYNIVWNIVILYIRHTLWIMFSNNLYRIVQKDASTRNRIYIVISGYERGSAKEKKCVNVCFLWMYVLRCFLKSNFYNRHIVCQNPDSEYWLLTKRYSICIFYNNCICVSFICKSLGSRFFNRKILITNLLLQLYYIYKYITLIGVS